MQTAALDLARQHADARKPERLSWGIVEFQVTDLERTIAFWTSTLGLQVRNQDINSVALGTPTKTLFVFHSGASIPASRNCLGMYHVAIGVPSQKEFSRLLARLIKLNLPNSPVDHLMSKAIYFNDPDDLEIEIALETPERFGRFGDMSRGLIMYDANGKAHSGIERLNLKAELSHAQDSDLDAPVSDATYLAHIHFKVSELDKAANWFEGIGFARNLMLPHFGFADMGAGAAYTHRLAMNTWAGPGLSPAPSDMARLVHYTLHVHDSAVVLNAPGIQPSGAGLTGYDLTGTPVSIVPTF